MQLVGTVARRRNLAGPGRRESVHDIDADNRAFSQGHMAARDTVLCNRYPDAPTQVELVRKRLCVVAYGMHTGHGLNEQRRTPQAEATHDEIDRMIQRYRADSPGTEREVHAAIQVRDELLSRSGILLPRDGDRAAFYHLTFQDFLAAQRLLDLEGERLLEAIRQRAEHPEWRSTLSFAFSSLLAKNASPDRAIRLLSAMIEGLPKRAAAADRLAIVAADCLEILWGRGEGLRPEHDRRLRDYCLSAIGREAPIKERCELGLALGRLGDPRIVSDVRDPAAHVQIPAGIYRIGDDRKKDYPDYFEPLDEEAFGVAQPFYLSRYPVTNAQYGMFLADDGYDDSRWWSDEGWRWKESGHVREPGLWRDVRWNGATQPVVCVSFWEAEAFCRWAGGRLPTEREWEAAARGPESLPYPWGDHWEDGICNSTEAKLERTSPVGIFPRSRSKAFGLEDMAGNVWEWTQNGPNCVLRGGAWGITARYCRAAIRARHHDLWEWITGYANLERAALKAARGKRRQRNVVQFLYNLEREICQLQDELRTRTYTPGVYRTFLIYEPKLRMISAAPFRDRVVHHALCSVLEWTFEPTFIHDSYACRRGKGTHAAVSRFTQFTRRNRYVLKCDLRKFFPSIDHQILKETVARKVKDRDVLWLVDRIIDGSNPQEPVWEWFPGDDLLTPSERRRGLPIGNQTSQFLANVFLNLFDHFVKETLRARCYIRYVDDFVILSDDKGWLAEVRERCRERLARMRLRLHPRKSVISRVADGTRFLGYRVFPDHRLLARENITRMRRRLARMQAAYTAGRLRPQEVRQRLLSWIGHARHADTFGLRSRLFSATIYTRKGST